MSISRPVYTPEQIPGLSASELLEDLSWMPIFRLSLSSKELFHSNFLEFLWMSDRSAFVRMIRNLLHDQDLLPKDPQEYYLDREKENFDICIYHLVDDSKGMVGAQEKAKRVIYDLIIENKVKSIPYKGQLLKYVGRVERKRRNNDPEPKYLLLSLAESFPDKNKDGSVVVRYKVNKGKKPKEGDATWKTVNYLTLSEEIRKGWKDTEKSSYITDYCDFIYRLHYLQRAILSTVLEPKADEPLFEDYDLYKKHRLHDLYVKLRCTKLMMHLKNSLMIRGVPVYLEPAADVRKKDAGVYLNVNVFNGVGQVGALVWDGGKRGNRDIYEVIVQGEQFRHGIGEESSSSKDKDWNRLNELWNRLEKDELSHSFLHGILGMTDQDIMPKTINRKEKRGTYDAYDSGYIYRYIPCKTWKALRLLRDMTGDVEDIARKLNVIQ